MAKLVYMVSMPLPLFKLHPLRDVHMLLRRQRLLPQFATPYHKPMAFALAKLPFHYYDLGIKATISISSILQAAYGPFKFGDFDLNVLPP